MSHTEQDAAAATTTPPPSESGLSSTAGAGSVAVQSDPAPVAVQTLVGQIESSQPDDDGLIILEEETDPPAEPQHSTPVAEEIVYID
jgi:hypothetical protein